MQQKLVKTDESDIYTTDFASTDYRAVQNICKYKIFLIYIFGVFTQFIGPSRQLFVITNFWHINYIEIMILTVDRYIFN